MDWLSLEFTNTFLRVFAFRFYEYSRNSLGRVLEIIEFQSALVLEVNCQKRLLKKYSWEIQLIFEANCAKKGLSTPTPEEYDIIGVDSVTSCDCMSERSHINCGAV